MKALTAYSSEQQPMGFFRIFATPPGGQLEELTLFRGAPTQIGSVSTQDPFTESTAQLTFPQVTAFDCPGEGDLDWLLPNTEIDIVFTPVGGYDFDWTWEGYIASYSINQDGNSSSMAIDLKGCLYGLDDYLAIPSFPSRPIPYEVLIRQAFNQDDHPSGLGLFAIEWPKDWQLKVKPFGDPSYANNLFKPWGVQTGDNWTGITSRQTGSWEPVLTGFVQTLLSVMYAEGGSQWSVRNIGRRRPRLYLRQIPDPTDPHIIEIDLGAPGVQLSAVRDYTQRAGVIYGQGQDEALIAFSNQQVTGDGRTTYYAPFAWDPQMYPRKNNPAFDRRVKPRETRIQFQTGLDEVSAARVALNQYHRFYEPGITGTITLTTDVRSSAGALVPRLLIRGGRTVRINGLLGIRDGVLAHVTQVQADFTQMTTALTFDTKYRDQLTVAEVRARTRDALNPTHALQVGKYTNTINDLIMPWSVKAGSGCIPVGAKDFFAKLPDDALFPFEKYTKQMPPSHPSSKAYYIEIGPTNTRNSNNNWSQQNRVQKDVHLMHCAIPIRMGLTGSIRLTQFGAYDKDGNVLRVKFHMSIWGSNGVAVDTMPQFPYANNDPKFPRYLKAKRPGREGTSDRDIPDIPTTYATAADMPPNQTHALYEGAWESVQPNGLLYDFPGQVNQPNNNANNGFCVGYGTYNEPAGYWPGRFSKGADRTGLLQDDQQWSWDLSKRFSPVSGEPLDEFPGMLFVMIYCDDQYTDSVYFMGRLIRVNPGTP